MNPLFKPFGTLFCSLRRQILFCPLLFLFSSVGAQAPTQWWLVMHDPHLNALMEEAFVSNIDVRMAQDKMLSARAAYRASLGAFLPQLEVDAGWQREQTSRHLTTLVTPATFESYYSGLLKGSLTIDIFGQLRKASNAQHAAFKAQDIERSVVKLTLSKEIASAYVSLCSTKMQIAVLSANIQQQEEIVKITQARYEAGLVSKLDVEQAFTTLCSTRADITQYRSQENAYLAQLAVLLETDPQSLDERLVVADHLPYKAIMIPDSLAMEHLRERPDLRQAEWLIEAQRATLGATQKEWLPTFLVNGYIGLMAHDTREMTHHHSVAWMVEPTMQWTLFSGGQRVQAIKQARYALNQQIDQYNLLLHTAIQQVETSATAYRQCCLQVNALEEAVGHAETSLELSSELYKMGLASFINVAQAQQDVLQYQTSWVAAQNKALQNYISFMVATSRGIE